MLTNKQHELLLFINQRTMNSAMRAVTKSA